ncbi:MAG TPA: nuclear transport factor 2 family protein [Thermoanaerobaculia bacterium]|nr:nuclear transport factor 2 family protein [Thermoanaerobaculia bacterium]
MKENLTELLEKEAIIETITRLFVSTDGRDWEAVHDCLADRVMFDMSSLGGAEAAVTDATTIVEGWEKGLRALKAIHHQAGNFLVELDGDRATAFCYAIASHYLPNASGQNTRVFVGSYDLGLRKMSGRWRIDAFRFNLKYIDGNRQLEEAAGEVEEQR